MSLEISLEKFDSIYKLDNSDSLKPLLRCASNEKNKLPLNIFKNQLYFGIQKMNKDFNDVSSLFKQKYFDSYDNYGTLYFINFEDDVYITNFTTLVFFDNPEMKLDKKSSLYESLSKYSKLSKYTPSTNLFDRIVFINKWIYYINQRIGSNQNVIEMNKKTDFSKLMVVQNYLKTDKLSFQRVLTLLSRKKIPDDIHTIFNRFKNRYVANDGLYHILYDEDEEQVIYYTYKEFVDRVSIVD